MFYGVFWLIGRRLTGYVIKHAERKKEHYKRSVSRRNKRKRQARGRNTARYDERVDERLDSVNTGYADRRKITEMVLCLNGDFDSANNNEQNESEKHSKPDKARFFADYSKNEIAFRKGRNLSFCRELRYPTPNHPPEPRAYNDCRS